MVALYFLIFAPFFSCFDLLKHALPLIGALQAARDPFYSLFGPSFCSHSLNFQARHLIFSHKISIFTLLKSLVTHIYPKSNAPRCTRPQSLGLLPPKPSALCVFYITQTFREIQLAFFRAHFELSRCYIKRDTALLSSGGLPKRGPTTSGDLHIPTTTSLSDLRPP